MVISETKDVRMTVSEIRTELLETQQFIDKGNLLIQQSLAERKGNLALFQKLISNTYLVVYQSVNYNYSNI